MKKAVYYALIGVWVSSLAFAQSAQESRGIEEENRDLLDYTQVHIPSAVSVPLPGSASPEMAYLDALYARPVARVADGERVAALLKGAKWDEAASGGDAPLRKGEAALLFCRALGIRGGIGRRLFPKSERYALRELVYEGIMSAEGPEEVVAGRELVGMFVAAVDFMEKEGGRPR
ncbi:MAG: hypothetical protein ACM3L6_03675 [Deltaproteobacteria bacterium]